MITRNAPPKLPPAHPMSQAFGFMAFFLMTLGFATYHILLLAGTITPFLGGYAGLMGVILFVPSMMVYVFQVAAQPWRFNRGDVLFFLFMALVGTMALYNWLGGNVEDVAESHLSIVTQLTVFFVIFKFLGLESKYVRNGLWISYVILSLIMLTLGLGGLTPEEYNEMKMVVDEENAGYMQYALVYFIVMTGCVSICDKWQYRITLYTFSAVILFYNGARSELIVSIPMFLFAEALISRRNAVILIVTAFLFLIFSKPLIDLLVDSFPNNRAVGLLMDFSADQSVRERQFLFENAIQVIEQHPFFGSYAYYEDGWYAHNFISAWADYGIFGFLLFIAGVVLPLAAALKNFVEDRLDPELLALACFALGSFALFMFAKFYGHQTFAVVLALYSRYLSRRFALDRLRLRGPQARSVAPAVLRGSV